MILVTGGSSQGKLAFVQSSLVAQDAAVAHGGSSSFAQAFEAPVLDKLHLLVERMLAQGVHPRQAVLQGVAKHPDIVVICDELGCGIVPVSREDRVLREEVGRLACILAQQATRVYRVVCGIPVCIKGGDTD